jgi:8-amino-7-oxononanoate synthase
MTGHEGAFGLAGAAKARLLERLTSRRGSDAPPRPPAARPDLGDAALRGDIAAIRRAGAALALESPFFRVHAGIARDTSEVEGRALVNFASYNYLGLNGDPRVGAAAKAAIDRYGTSVSASRITAGERPVHAELEAALAALHGAEDALALISGHATNVTVIGHLVGPGDAVVHDAFAHNSIVQGALLSSAQRVVFAHNDPVALERALRGLAGKARRILVVIEGHYSMDGDIPDLAAMLAAVRRHQAWLMVDEAHSVGVLGAAGSGVAEELGIDPREVDIWMGTLSKTLVSCGGYVAGARGIIKFLRITVPGFLYSVGMPGPVAAAACEAMAVMQAEPWRVARLRENAALFLAECRRHGLDTGTSIGAAIVPVILGSSIKAARCADLLFRRGINVQPVMSPAVPERAARLRFFLSALHTPEQLREAAAQTAAAVAETAAMRLDLAELALRLRG